MSGRCGLWIGLWLWATAGGAAEPSPLADAVEARDQARIAALLETSVAIDAPQADGMTALHWGAYHGDRELVDKLLMRGAAVDPETRYEITPLSLALLHGHAAVVDSLVAAKANVRHVLPGEETLLMVAARTGLVAPLRRLIQDGADLEARDRKGQTATMWAAAEGHAEAVAALIEAGADWRVRLRSGWDAGFFAAREGKMAVVERLLAAGADVNAVARITSAPGSESQRNRTLLLVAVENGHFSLAARLLERGADPNAMPGGFSALHAITWVRKPLRGDGDPPPIGSGELTSLDLVRALVSRGADVNARYEHGGTSRGKFTTAGSTPFLFAARTADLPLMQLLAELGADITLTNRDGCPPLLAAAGVGALEGGDEAPGTEAETIAAVEWLLERGADINTVDKNGETVMHGAAYHDWSKLVPLLVARGADIAVWNRENRWGWTPLVIATGYRPGNFRPEPDTIAALHKTMLAQGVTPPRDPKPGMGAAAKDY